MVFKKGVSTEVTGGSDNWNIADGYVKLKILLPLVVCDKLIKIAIYGAEHIEESLMFPPELKTTYRIEAIKRLSDELRLIIENTLFCLKADGKKQVYDLWGKLKEIEKVLPGIQSVQTDQRVNQSTVSINENHFAVCLGELRKIKTAITIPLNTNALIFPTSDEIDLDKLKSQLIHGG